MSGIGVPSYDKSVVNNQILGLEGFPPTEEIHVDGGKTRSYLYLFLFFY